MIAINLLLPAEIQQEIAARARQARLRANMSQKELAQRSGVSPGSVKRFESTGEISLKALLGIAMVLNELAPFAGLFPPPPGGSLFAEEEPAPRKRSGKGPSNIPY